MKFKYAFLTLLAGAAFAFTGCVQEDPVNDAALAVNVEPSILNMGGAAAEQTQVEVTATAPWTVSDVPSWMTVTPPSGSAGKTSVTIAVEAGEEKARSAQVVFKAANDTKILTVNQEGGVTYGTRDNPYTCAKAVEFCSTLADRAKGPKEVYVKGIITSIVEKYGTQYGNATFFMSDDGSADSPQFEVYRAYYFDNKKYDDETKQNINVGDEVLIYGFIMNYGGQAETSQNEAYLIELKEGSSPILVGDVTSAEILAEDTEATFAVSAKNLKGKWTVTPKETYSWVTDYTKEGTESGEIVVKVAANTSEEARTAEFTVSAEGVSDVLLTLTQKGAQVVNNVAGIVAQITSTDSKNPSAYSANLTGAVVSYVNGNNAYIEDESGAILLYLSNHGLTPGKKISGVVKGTGYLYNALPEITAIGTEAKIEDGGTIPETVITVADLVANYNANLSRRVKLVGVTVKDAIADGDRNGAITQDGADIIVYAALNKMGLVMEEGAKGDLICYPTLYKENKQVSFWDNNDWTVSSAPQPDGTIKTADELIAWMAAPTADAKLGADIDLTGKTLTPIAEYAGVLDGQGHTLKNLQASAPLFETLTGTVKNLTIEGNVSLTLGEDAAAGHPLAVLATVSKGTIENVTNKANVSISSTGILGSPVVAGLVAYQEGGSLKNVSNYGKISLTHAGSANVAIPGFNRKPFVVVSGVVGVLFKSTIENALNEGEVTVIGTDPSKVSARHYVGGVVGTPEGAVITACVNKGAIQADFTDPDKKDAKQVWVGGVIGGRNGDGKDYDGALVTNCDNYGTCTLIAENALNHYLSGIAAQANAEATSNLNDGESAMLKIVGCHNYGKLIKKGAGGCRLGGIHGGAATMENCINEGEIVVEGISDAGAVGGLVGYPTQAYHPVTNCKNLGNITVTCDVAFAVGGLFGQGGNTNQAYSGCSVNTVITAPESVNAGLIVGTAKTLSGSKKIVYGTAEAPFKVKGTVKGVVATAENYQSLLIGDGGKTAAATAVFDTTNVQFGE